jgi:hypothetical protein
MVVIFSGVFVASGAMSLAPLQVVPDENNLLNLQARFVTGIHPWLLPLYIAGAFLTMIGTLYGTVEIACSITDEILRSFATQWSDERAKRLKHRVILWCGPIAMSILLWLCVRQLSADNARPIAVASTPAATAPRDPAAETGQPQVQKPKLLLAIMTPVNLFTGVMSCGLICTLSIWMDRRWLPPKLRPPVWISALNGVAALIFVGLGIKGYIDNENRIVVVCGMGGLLVLALIIASMIAPSNRVETLDSTSAEGATG